MSRFERGSWTVAFALATVMVLYTLTLPEDEGRRLWNDSDPLWCSSVGIAVMLGCVIWLWRHAREEQQP